ncbi:hypothetical protein BBUCA112A_D0009 (plasmid) [Borreliella burgdorferi CA-11.2A]|nr:hypothetical protein BBUCA112A_D0009 [Borreliella burgdorferi CA-11.2A]ACN92324.1 hypothetical protein BBU94A_D10 [Borreliella burgdorferi 94a]
MFLSCTLPVGVFYLLVLLFLNHTTFYFSLLNCIYDSKN